MNHKKFNLKAEHFEQLLYPLNYHTTQLSSTPPFSAAAPADFYHQDEGE